MQLPQSETNVNPGLYFVFSEEKVFFLLKIEDKETFFMRKSGQWEPFSGTAKYWSDPSGIPVVKNHSKAAIDLLDSHHRNGTMISIEEISRFTAIF